MSANPAEFSTVRTDSVSAQALYFGSGTCQVFGWLHSPASIQRATLGVVICKPFGFEAMSAHLSIRALAEAAAEVGVPALRFDYAGTGDSEDIEPGTDQMQAWSRDIESAINELQRRTGVKRVCLLGIRLGALLAAQVAERCPQVCSILAVAPLQGGRRYFRELKTFELAAAARTGEQAPVASNGDFEANGFILNAKTLAALQQIELQALPLPNVSDVLIIDREDLPAAKAWRDQLSTAGIRVQYTALPGFVEMLMRPPNLTEVPEKVIAAARDWLSQQRAAHAQQSSHLVAVPRASDAGAQVPQLTLRNGPASTISENPAVLRADPFLFGIVTVPRKEEIRRRGVILLNSGGDHHIGPRRLYVTLARDWAKHGYFVLRVDISGLGDSAERPGHARNELFPVEATADIQAAVDYLRTHHAVTDVTLCGICSGASHTVRAVFEGVSVNRVLLINPLIFYWKDGEVNLDEVQPWEVVHKPGAYLSRVFSVAAWRRLFFGDVSIWRVAQIYLNRPVMMLQSRFRKWARAAHIRLKNDLGADLRALQESGVRIVFVFSEGDAGLNLLMVESGLSLEELRERYALRMIDDADHEFSRSGPREALAKVLSEELYAPNPSQRSASVVSISHALRP
jgi:pimeloyl-ACP methyl ester carboxylesterase